MKGKFGAYHSLSKSARTFFFAPHTQTQYTRLIQHNTVGKAGAHELEHVTLTSLVGCVASSESPIHSICNVLLFNQDMRFKKPRKHLNRLKNDRVAQCSRKFVVSSAAELYSSPFESRQNLKRHIHTLFALDAHRCNIVSFFSYCYLIALLLFDVHGVLNGKILCIERMQADTVCVKQEVTH